MLGSVHEPIEVMTKEMSQVLGDRESPVAAKIKKLAYGPAPGRLGVAPSALLPALSEEVSQARRDWPAYQPASEAVFTMPRATPSIIRKRRLAGPGFWDTIINSIKKDWKWWLGGSVLAVVVIAIIAGGGRKE